MLFGEWANPHKELRWAGKLRFKPVQSTQAEGSRDLMAICRSII